MNKYTGVLGVYNCQGAAWNSIERKNTFHQTKTEALTGYIRGRDVHLISEAIADPEWSGDCILYCQGTGELTVLPYNVALPVTLKVLEHQIFTVTPLKAFASGHAFAPIGLIGMFNSGGAIEDLKYESTKGNSAAVARIQVKGRGKFGAYSSVRPRRCVVGGIEVEFGYDESSGLVTFSLDSMPEEGKKHVVEVEM